MAFIVVYMGRLGVGPLASFMSSDLLMTKAQFGLFASSPSLGIILVSMPAGWATDRLGVRWVLCFSQVIIGVSLIALFIMQSYLACLIAMFMMGVGHGALFPATGTGIVMWFTARERAMALGIQQSAVNLGGLLAAVTLPVLAITYGWRFGFLVMGIIATALGVLSFILYRNPTADKSKNCALMSSGVTGMNAVPTCNNSVEKEHSLAALFKSVNIWLLTAAGVCLIINEFGVFNFFVLYLQEHMAAPMMEACSLLAAVHLGGFFGKPICGVISDRIFGGRRKHIFMMLGIVATIFTIVLGVLPMGSSQWLMFLCAAIYGFAGVGWGGIFFAMIGEFAGKERCGVATGTASGIFAVSVMVGPPLVGHLVDKTGSWMWFWVCLVFLAATATVLLFFVSEESKRL